MKRIEQLDVVELKRAFRLFLKRHNEQVLLANTMKRRMHLWNEFWDELKKKCFVSETP